MPRKIRNRKSKTGKSKYGNKKVVIDGFKFDSLAESRYYLNLLQQKKAGLIKDFKMQVPYKIYAGDYHKGVKIRDITYKADFVVTFPDGAEIVIDVKGKRTEVFNIKAKLLLKQNPDMDFWLVREPSPHRFIIEPLYGSRKESEVYD